ncbi:MAG: peptidylprolyl isomerase [Clostridiaceae bacterium]|nr:peptidylprolyl isomerase [Clostridiaceae bacterium]
MYILCNFKTKFQLTGVDILPEKVKKKMAIDMKIFIVVCIVVVLILGAAIVYIVMPKDIAKVKNNRVTNSEFTYYYSMSYQQLYSYYLIGQLDEQTLVELAKQQALSQAVEIEYLLQEAEKEGFTVSKDEIDEAWNEVDSSLKTTAAEYGISMNTLSRQYFGVKYNQAKNIFKDSVKAQKYYEKLISDMQADEEELKAYYEENKESFDYNTVRHILIKVDKNAEDSVVEEKKKTAQSILDRVNNGEDFAELAKEYSEDTGSAENGGLYDVKKGQMVQEFEEWTFSHEVGDTGLIKTVHGFHVMKLEGITNTFDALKDTVANSFKINKYQTALQETLSNGEYQVEIKDAYYEFTGM